MVTSSNLLLTFADQKSLSLVGGTVSEIHEYPWHVGIQLKSSKGTTKPFCGGAIIHPNYVITAAHCMIHSKDNMEILIAEHITNDLNESIHFFKSSILTVTVHENYDKHSSGITSHNASTQN